MKFSFENEIFNREWKFQSRNEMFIRDWNSELPPPPKNEISSDNEIINRGLTCSIGKENFMREWKISLQDWNFQPYVMKISRDHSRINFFNRFALWVLQAPKEYGWRFPGAKNWQFLQKLAIFVIHWLWFPIRDPIFGNFWTVLFSAVLFWLPSSVRRPRENFPQKGGRREAEDSSLKVRPAKVYTLFSERRQRGCSDQGVPKGPILKNAAHLNWWAVLRLWDL